MPTSDEMTVRATEVRRVHDRYFVEFVEAFELCPWARSARVRGELAFEILWGTPTDEDWFAASRRAYSQPGMRVAMVVAPELVIDTIAFHNLRNRVTDLLGDAGVAEFLPDAPLDLVSAARLVPYLRRSPDPLLQIVPIALLESVRAKPTVVDRATQAMILEGHYVAPRGDVADQIADTNHRRISRDRVAAAAVLDAIRADRDASYARVGISSSR